MSDDDRYRPDRPVFCGNFEYNASSRDIERLFDKYGRVERVDMKTGFAFVYMKDRRDGEDAIRALDRVEFGYRRRRLRVEWAKGNGEVKKREEMRKRQSKPTATLFVVNFDVERTREKDLERHFRPYGRLARVQIKNNYAFVQFEAVEDAEKVLKDTDRSKLLGRSLNVEYVSREADGRRISPGREGYRSRSRSPYMRRRSRSRSRGRSRRIPSPKRKSSPSPSPRQSRSPELKRSRSRSLTPRRSRSRSYSGGRSRSRSASPKD